MASDAAYISSDDTLAENRNHRRWRRESGRQPTETLSDTSDVIDIAITVQSREVPVYDVPKALLPRLTNIANRLDEISRLPVNWDSYGAPTVSTESLVRAVEVACDILIRLDLDPFIAPASCGGITLDWETGDTEIEIEICDDTASLIFPTTDDDRATDDIPVTRAKMLLLDWLKP